MEEETKVTDVESTPESTPAPEAPSEAPVEAAPVTEGNL